MSSTFFFGPQIFADGGGPDPHGIAFAKEVAVFEGRSYTGVTDKIQPGIDGVLTDDGALN